MAQNSNSDIGKLPFERAIEELESIVKRLEEGKVPLEESIAIYERGEALKHRCEELLRQAEARVEKITLDAGGKPTGTEHVVQVGTTDPARGFTLAFTADSLELSATEAPDRPDLALPSEAFVRLVYGRLDSAHTPAGVEGPVLDDLRRAFPGF